MKNTAFFMIAMAYLNKPSLAYKKQNGEYCARFAYGKGLPDGRRSAARRHEDADLLKNRNNALMKLLQIKCCRS